MEIDKEADKEKTWDIVVVGGGMVGATTALGLAQQGFEVLLLEMSVLFNCLPNTGDFRPRVSALTRASENIFKSLGVWQIIEQNRHCAFTDMHVWEDVSNAEIHFSAKEIGEENLGFVIENDSILNALWQKIETESNIEVLFGQQVEAINLTAETAELSFKDGKEIQTKLLIGADGAFSKIRQLVGINQITHSYNQCAIVGCVETEKSSENTCWQRYRQEGPFAFLAMGNNVSSIAWYLPQDKMEWALSLSEQDYKSQIEQASGLKLGKVTKVYERAGFPLVRRHAEHYVQPHFALVGDAAHTIHPQAGQGVNLGLLDAAALIEVVSNAKTESNSTDKYTKDWSRKSVLRRYERWRKGDNALMQRSMEGFDWLFKQDNELKNQLRTNFVSFANKLKPVKNWLTEQALNGRGQLPKLATSRRNP